MLRTDFENLHDGQRVRLFPAPSNPIHRAPVSATFSGGYFYCDGTPPTEGPDYYFGDILLYCKGFTGETDAE